MYSPSAQKPWVGRVEDERLLRGQGRFSDDLREPNTLFACFVRSPHAFAKIIRIDIAQANAMPGVLAVLTGAEAGADYVLETSIPGVLAAGDVRAGSTKRCATAVGEGAMAVQFVHAHLSRTPAVEELT